MVVPGWVARGEALPCPSLLCVCVSGGLCAGPGQAAPALWLGAACCAVLAVAQGTSQSLLGTTQCRAALASMATTPSASLPSPSSSLWGEGGREGGRTGPRATSR